MESKYLKTRAAALAISSLICLDSYAYNDWTPGKYGSITEKFEYEGIEYGVTNKSYTSYISDVYDAVCTIDYADTRHSKDVVIPSQVCYNGKIYPVISIGPSTFSNCKNLESITIPSSVEFIEERAFEKCVNLTSISMPPESVRVMCEFAFSECENLSKIVFPNTLIYIDTYTFLGCKSVTEIHIPENLEYIGLSSFTGFGNLVKITCDENNPFYSAEEDVLFSKYKDTLVRVPPMKKDINNLKIPSSVTFIGKYAFCGCEYLYQFQIPDNVDDFGICCFEGCDNLKNIVLNEKSISIPKEAFWGCRSLKEFVIPSKVQSIEEGAFYFCDSLKKIYIKNPIPPKLENGEFLQSDFSMIFPSFDENTFREATLFVPIGTLQAYKCAYVWEKFQDIREYDFSAVDEIAMQQADIRIEDGSIVVTGNDANIPVEVFTTSGNKVYSGHDPVISSLPHGMYIVKVGTTARRVIL